MSASSKKKLRTQQASGKLTEKQLEELKKNRETKLYTIGFTVVMTAILVIAIAVGGIRLYQNSGVRERKTVAYTVGEHNLTSAELNYFFTDSVNNFVNQYGAYAAMFGLDTTKPLDQQIVDEEAGTTWADDFMNSAKESAKAVYALVDEANANGYALTEKDLSDVDMAVNNLELYAKMNGLSSAKDYLKAMYGNGATLETYRAYLENSVLADSYNRAHAQSIVYEDADFREHEKDNYDQYSSFSYNQYYMSVDSFLKDGEVDEEGNVTFTQEQKDAAAKAAEEAAKSLVDDKIKTAADLDKAIGALEINKESANNKSSFMEHKDFPAIPSDVAQWLSDSSRKAGDKTYIPSTSTTEDEDGKSVTNTVGYTVLMFQEKDDNTDLLPDVRHILVSFEGGTTNEQGQKTYTDEEKAAAKTKAEDLLKQFEAGEQTEEAFAALAAENTTDPGSKENGGLYENVYRGQMVPAFNDWVFEADRKAGDTGVVETEYGYHVMYFCGEGTSSYRDLKIKSELLNADMEQWTKDLLDATVTADGDTSLINTSLVLSR